jgi:hypothetical protein
LFFFLFLFAASFPRCDFGRRAYVAAGDFGGECGEDSLVDAGGFCGVCDGIL